MFLSRISIIYDAKNTLVVSSTMGGAIGGAYIIDTLRHFACILTHFVQKTKGFPIENPNIFRPKLKVTDFWQISRDRTAAIHDSHTE